MENEQERIGTDSFEGGFTRIPYHLYSAILVYGLSLRQLKVVLFIAKLTFGCHVEWANLKQSDPTVIGISSTHAKEVIKSLLDQAILVQNDKTKQFKINQEYLISYTTHEKSPLLDKLASLVGKHIHPKSTQKGNTNVTNLGTSNFPKKETYSSQNGNEESLPKEEQSASQNSNFSPVKDIVKDKFLNSEKYPIAFPSNEMGQLVDPNSFSPSNACETAALDICNEFEPHSAYAFTTTYLWACRLDVAADRLYQFASETRQDPSVKNKGAVFRKKVKDYLARRKSQQ